MTFNPRPLQKEILTYRHGYMGVSAVPGSGKTQTLSYLASLLITENLIEEDQEILVVTLVNSAVNNFNQRIEGFIKNSGLLPGMGYRVRTLHGLANDIIRERPDLEGLSNQFQIIDERDASDLLNTLSIQWLRANPWFVDYYTDSSSTSQNNRPKNWEDLVTEIARSFIRLSKDREATHNDIAQLIKEMDVDHPLLRLGAEVYSGYQRALNLRGSIDFDDLIRLALDALRQDSGYQERIHRHFPYILEDEAQDSSRLQECILQTIAGPDGNWVRVGDPNQAIFETFTTASPEFLLNFIKEHNQTEKNLANSGRSSSGIIDLANYLIKWTKHDHPIPALRHALNYPLIELTPPGDPQPNPPFLANSIYISPDKRTPEAEMTAVVRSVGNWIKEHPDQTAAILVPRNERGVKIISELKEKGVPTVENLSSTLSTRQTAQFLADILSYLDDPSSNPKCARILAAFAKAFGFPESINSDLQTAVTFIKKCPRLEDFLAPWPGNDWLNQLRQNGASETVLTILSDYRGFLKRWTDATLLRIDQLLLFIAGDIFKDPAELALSHKLALLLERTLKNHPDWRFPQLIQELNLIANNERKFIGFTGEDTGFDPDQYKGKVTVTTIHKAKGLEWDRVYILSVNNYDFPSAEIEDQFISEKSFIRGRLNLPEEALARLEALLKKDKLGVIIEEGPATLEARNLYAAERLRLFYVGLTRARKELMVTWNSGRFGNQKPSLPFSALYDYWKSK